MEENLGALQPRWRQDLGTVWLRQSSALFSSKLLGIQVDLFFFFMFILK